MPTKILNRHSSQGERVADVQVMRLKPYCCISNRTGQRLQLLQWQSASCAQFYDDEAGGGTAVRDSVRGLPRAEAASRGPPSMSAAIRDSSVDWTSCMDLPAGRISADPEL